MKQESAASPAAAPQAVPDFSLVLGGPLFQLMRGSGLANDALALVHRRIAVAATVSWLPLLVLSAIEGRLSGNGQAIPFLNDLETHIRFLVAIPILIGAELVVHQRLRPLIAQFKARNLVPGPELARFDGAVSAAMRLRNSVVAEVLLIAFVYFVGVFVVWRQYFALDAATTWYTDPSGAESGLSLAGLWYVFVSLPLFQFLLCRWYFRLFVWARFLWQVSRIDLALVPTHPDRVGGLGFLGGSVRAFAPLGAALGTVAAGQVANRIYFAGARLPEFTIEIASVALVALFVFVAPLVVFAPQLLEAKRTGLREYGLLAERYVRGFDTKWLRGGAPGDEPLVGSGDIQSLADLSTSYAVVESMNSVPVSRNAIMQFVFATILPFGPLLLTMMPLEQLIRNLVGMVL
jgi:hypothetical protein